MGYDMQQVTEHPEAKQHREALKVERDNAERKLKQLRDAGADGSWLTDEERATLSGPEAEALEDERHKAWRSEYLKSDQFQGLGDLIRAELAAKTTPALQEYIDAQAEHERLVMKEPKHSGYFRLNIWGMSRYAGAMDALGMLKNTRDDNREFPEPPFEEHEKSWALDAAVEYATEDVFDHVEGKPDIQTLVQTGIASDRWQADYPQYVDQVSPEEIAKYAAYRQAVETHLSAHDDTVPGIDQIKFSTNDGWLVTPEECASAVKVWDDLPEHLRVGIVQGEGDQPGLGEYWLSWIEYLRDGAALDGFRVH